MTIISYVNIYKFEIIMREKYADVLRILGEKCMYKFEQRKSHLEALGALLTINED